MRPGGSALHLVLTPDLKQPQAGLLADLSLAEREQAEQYALTERRYRHFILGRLAAHAAVRQVMRKGVPRHGAPLSAIEVTEGCGGAPQVRVDGTDAVISVSLSHSCRLVAACAWFDWPGGWRSAGVDLERLRPTEVAQSRYAFSREERRLLARAPEGPGLAGLAAWTVKEAAWKALRPSPDAGPAEIEVRALSLARGSARVELGTKLQGYGSATGDHNRLRVRVGAVRGPDGPYVLSLAEIRAGRGGGQPGCEGDP